MNKGLEESELDDLYDFSEDNILPPDNIVVLNELRSAADLNRLMKDEDSFDIKPDFQREEVWGDAAKARFVDSLSKEFPIPSMCFALDPKEQKFIVIDGRQRMSTINKFLTNNDWRLPNLEDIDSKVSGKLVQDIRNEYPEIYRKIENVSLPVTILRYDPKRKDNMEYIFTIFQRLNSLGEKLNNQEIRNAIFQGSFSKFIRDCAHETLWDELFGSRSARMVSEERVLRFFAFYEEQSAYTGKLTSFLNNYMQNKRLSYENTYLHTIFVSTLNIANKVEGTRINKSNALRDAFLYGISQNISHLENMSAQKISKLLAKLESDPHFTTDELSGAIMAKKKVTDRLKAARVIFSEEA